MRQKLNLVILAELLELRWNNATRLCVDLQDGEIELLVIENVDDRVKIHVSDAELRHLSSGLRFSKLLPKELEVLLGLGIVVGPDELLRVGA